MSNRKGIMAEKGVGLIDDVNLCRQKAGEMVDRGDNTYGGKYVVNPSGGLISKGHPLGATGKYSDLIVTIIMLPVQVRLRDIVILIYLSSNLIAP